jgi:hypothetical protein
MDKITEIFKAIREYAEVYSTFEKLQKETSSLLPKHGDQKTGIIGEFYVYQYLRDKRDLKYSEHGNAWDIEYTDEKTNKIVKIQVKTALTGFSKTNTLSPIKKGWDFIYLVSLNKKFMPNGFWINKYDENMFKGREIIQSARIKDPANDKSKGSEIFDFKENLVDKLLPKLMNGQIEV